MASVRVSCDSQRVSVVAEERDDIAVEGAARVQRDGDRTTVDRASSGLTIRVPTGTDIVIGATSGRVDVKGTVGAASIVTESGRIEIVRELVAKVVGHRIPRLGGRPPGSQLCRRVGECLGNRLGVGDRRHEVRVSGPSRDDMDVEVVRHRSTGARRDVPLPGAGFHLAG